MNQAYNDTNARTRTPDAVILGGGCAGLWTLHELLHRGYDAHLIETNALGQGQTIWSQGILHSGLKYTLTGTLNKAARAIQDMPARWMQSIRADTPPDLSAATLRADHCHLWRTNSIASRAGMIGARVGLKTKPQTIDPGSRPAPLTQTPGAVARIDEPVIDPVAFLNAFRNLYTTHIHHIPKPNLTVTGTPESPTLHTPVGTLSPRTLIIAAGNGANTIRQALNLPTAAMQVRPLHMIALQGPNLPTLNGHCVDGNVTRITITTQNPGPTTTATHPTWQIGGQIAERGPSITPDALIAHARNELIDCIPGLEQSGALKGARWTTYDAPRAEGATRTGRRPETPSIIKEANTITIWPSKLVLAPQAATLAAEQLPPPSPTTNTNHPPIDLPSPPIASYPWDQPTTAWTDDAKIHTTAH